MTQLARPLLALVGVGLMLLPSRAAAQQREPYAGVDAFVESAMQAMNVPGVAIAIVRNDSLVYAKGYGVRDVGSGVPVDSRTVFAIGSSSKAFTAAAVVMLADSNKVSLDAQASTYLPGLQLADPYATRELTVRDLLSHRSGLARGELAWYGSGYDRDEIVRRVRYLAPSWSFRSQFGYQNIMYIAAGQVVAHAGNTTWDDFIRDRIFAPLGMNSSTTTVRELTGRPNLASPHYTANDTVRAIPNWRNIDNAGAAGSINSNVEDMAQWLRLQLGRGSVGGKRIVSARMIDQMHRPHIVIPIDSTARATNPYSHLSAYGLGWFLQDYRGQLAIHHGGNVDGFTALVGMLPERNVGVVILTNMNGTPLPTAIMHKVFDLHLQAPPHDWLAELRVRTDSARVRASRAQQRAAEQRVPNTRPSLPLSSYAGTYVDSLYGEVVVRERNGTLSLSFGPNWSADLTHWHFDTFHGKFDTPVLPAIPVLFRLNAAGKVSDVQLDMAGLATFTRRPEPPAAGTPRASQPR